MNYNILATGSGGNAVIINDNILIDCGVPFKTLEPYSKDLRLVLLTHAHGDHFKPSTVRTLHKRRPALRFGCCEWMVPSLLEAGVDKRRIDVFSPGIAHHYGALFSIGVAPTIHDVPNCCYMIFDEEYKFIFYATDCATLNGIVARNYDLYLIEANHRRDEIDARIAEKRSAGEYAYEVEAKRNHLSEEQALDWLAQNMGPHSKYVFLHQHRERGEPCE